MTRLLILLAWFALVGIALLRRRRRPDVRPEQPRPGYRYSPGMEKADPKKIKAVGSRRWKQIVRAQRSIRKAEIKSKPKKMSLVERRTGTDA